MKAAGLWCASAVLVLLALYAALAILQAGSLYQDARAASNLRFWGLILLTSGAGAAVCGYLAARSKRKTS
jgi:multisubunit Na+/H+ antiporter MnhG subunit